MTATLLFSTSMLLLCVFISLEVFSFVTLRKSELILLLDAHMPIINRKSIAVAAMGFVVLFIQTWSVNTVRGQEVARLRAGLNTSTEKIMLMCVPVVVLVFADVLCIVYAKELKRALATGLLLMIKDYDSNSRARDAVDHLQNFYGCCGVNNAEDYEDLSRVDLYGSPNPFSREKTLQSCPQSDLACLYPITCCASVECTEYRLAALNIEGDRFHERWYKSRGCVDALFAAHFLLLDPQISIWLISMALICEAAALVFAQLTLTSYLTLSESGLSDADESMAWLLPFTYPSPDDVVQVTVTR